MATSLSSEHEAIPLGDRIDTNGSVPVEDTDDMAPRPERDLAWTEDMTIKKQNLSKWDVASLILNKMVGTGIFTTPGLVLGLTQSKGLSVALWVLGGFYCGLCLVVYLDYGTALPFNGGELIYLNKIWPMPELFTAVLFAAFFISLGHTAGNSVAFSRHILIAASSTLPSNGSQPSQNLTNSGPDSSDGVIELDARLVKSFAIIVLAAVCFLLWVSPKTGLFLNRVLALYKIILLSVIGFAGINARNSDHSGKSDSDWKKPVGGLETTSGFIYIIYSYTGWENANYVIGDIKTKRQDLRFGAFAAVITVTFLYTLVNVGYFLACTSEEITEGSSDLGMASIFAEKVFGESMGLKVCIAISAVGNLIAVAYTSSKVKQAIALHHFLPFSTFFAKDDSFCTPGGALLLHWICSSIVILAMSNNTDGYGFVLGLFTYGQLLVGIALAVGLPRLKGAMSHLKYGAWKPFLSTPWANWMCGSLLAAINLTVLIGAAGPHKAGTTARYWWPSILAIILAVASVWWFGLGLLQGRFGSLIGWKATIINMRDLDTVSGMNRELRRDGADKMLVYDTPQGKPVAEWKRRVGPRLEWLADKLF